MFDQLQHAQCQYAREVLTQNYVSEAGAIFRAQPEHTWVPSHLHDKFLRSIRCLQSLHIGQTLQITAQKVLDLFVQFAATDNQLAMFIINLIVDKQTSKICYAPDPFDALVHAFDHLKMVKSAVCSLPVVPSSISAVKGYGETRIVYESLADILLKDAENMLDLTYKKQVCMYI